MADFPTKGAMPYGAKLKAYIDDLFVGVKSLLDSEAWLITDPRFGVPLDGVTDATAAFNAAVDEAAAAGRTLIVCGAERFKFTGGITWRAHQHTIVASGHVTLDFTAMTSGRAVSAVGQQAMGHTRSHRGAVHRFSGFQILGPEADATTVDALYINDTNGVDQTTFEHLLIIGFRDQVVLDTNNWCINFNKVVGGRFRRYGVNAEAGFNAGENYHFYGCTFYDGQNVAGTATAVRTSPLGNSDMYFYGCSFDYNNIEFDHGGGVVNLFGCHVEDRSGTNPMIKLTSTGGGPRTTFAMFGGQVAPTEVTPGRTHIIEHTAGSTSGVSIQLEGVQFTLYDKRTDVLKSLAAARPSFLMRGGWLDNSGGAAVRAGAGDVANLLYNGYFEDSAAFGSPGWRTQGSMTTMLIDTTLPKSGTRSLHLVGAASTAQVYQFFPVVPDAQVLIRGYYRAASASAGALNIRLGWYRNDVSITGGTAPTTTRTAITNLASVASGVTTGVWLPFSTIVTPPKGVTYGYVDAEASGFTGEVWVDELEVVAL